MPGEQAVRRGERVEVTIPARPEFVSVARLAAAAVAARQGFTYDEIEDLKIAVSEACASLLTSGSAPGAPVAVRFLLGRDALEILIETRGPRVDLHSAASGEDVPVDEGRMGVFVMQCLVDEVETHHDAQSGITVLRLVKRHQE